MTSSFIPRWIVLSILVAFLCVGCASNQKKLEEDIKRQAELIDTLTAENQRLQAEAEQARQSAAAAQQRAQNAEADLAALRQRVQSTPPVAVSARGTSSGRAGAEPVMGGAQRSGTRFTLESKVLFALGKSTLTPEGERALRKVAGVIKSQFPGKYVRIEGHTDNLPIKSVPGKTNLELSNERAEAVWHFLVNQCGLDPRYVYTAGYGQYRPVASNRTESGRQANRRVEIVVVDE